jgi:hypothetical protein
MRTANSSIKAASGDRPSLLKDTLTSLRKRRMKNTGRVMKSNSCNPKQPVPVRLLSPMNGADRKEDLLHIRKAQDHDIDMSSE